MANPTPDEVKATTAPSTDEQAPNETTEAKAPSLDWTRADLDAYAEGLGLNEAASLPNKQAVLDAIAQTQPETAPSSSPVPEGGEGADEAEPEPDEPIDEVLASVPEAAPEAEDGTTYRALKAITLADGRTVMPGDTFVIDASWPARRAKQLVDQKYVKRVGGD